MLYMHMPHLSFQDEAIDFGIDWNGPPVVENDITVEVPNIFCPLEEEMDILQSAFTNDSLDDIDGDMGIALYICTRTFVKSCINSD